MPDIEHSTDSDLVAAYRAGDTDAFAAIYDRYADVVFSFFLTRGISRAEAADGANDAFAEAARRLDVQESPDSLEPWLLGIAAAVSGGPDVGIDPRRPENIVAAPPALRPRVLDKVDEDVVSTFGRALDPEWMNIGLFAVITLVVGLIGLVVSAQFEPIERPPGNTNSPAASATTTTSVEASPGSSAPGSTTGTTPDQGTPSSTAAREPAALVVSTDSVNFGEDGTSNEIELTNTGGQVAEWEITSSSGAIAPSAGRGELEPGGAVTIELTLDRENIGEGDLDETLTVTWSGGQEQIVVTGSHEDNPIIHSPTASPSSVQVSGDSECTNTRTTVLARVRDTSELESVVVRWSPDGGSQQETAMSSIGDDMFEAVIGPFTAVQTAEARVVAFDERGNAGGASTQVAVVECP